MTCRKITGKVSAEVVRRKPLGLGVKNFFDQRIFHYQLNMLNRHGFKLFKNLQECVNTTFSNL